MRKIELGFYGAAVLAVRVSEKDLELLRSKLGDEGWTRVEIEDGEIDVDLGKLAFVRVAGDGQKVGF